MSSRSSGGKNIASLHTSTPIPQPAGTKEGFTIPNHVSSRPQPDYQPIEFYVTQQHSAIRLTAHAAKSKACRKSDSAPVVLHLVLSVVNTHGHACEDTHMHTTHPTLWLKLEGLAGEF